VELSNQTRSAWCQEALLKVKFAPGIRDPLSERGHTLQAKRTHIYFRQTPGQEGKGQSVTHLVRLGDGADALDVHVDGDLHRGACEAANKAVSH
jgi:hypothetical protein